MHDLSLAAQFADNFLCMADGRVDATGSAGTVLTAARARRIWGVEAEVAEGPGGCPRITPLHAV